MDLTQLANLGEFIGGVAVLGTLIYLAVQVRSNRRSTDFLIEQGVAGQFNQVNVAMIGNKDVANLWRRGVESRRALDDDERVQFHFLVQSYMNIHHIVFDLGSKGFVDQRLFEATKMELAQYRESQGFREALEGRAFWYGPEFGALLGLDRRAAKTLGSD